MDTQATQTRAPEFQPPAPQAQGMFRLPDGRNVLFTFILVSTLFMLWGFGNGMIDVMDKHFQDELHLSLSQSANVQFAHYLGYFLMAFPAGWLAIRLGYRGGLIAGLMLVAVGGFWFFPATEIKAFWAFLLGVCLIAAGFTFLETIANPYTTVLGNPRYASARINLAQSMNGIGWVLGPIAGRHYFYSKNPLLWKPYFFIAVVVVILAVIFTFTYVPDVKTEDEYHLDAGEDSEEGEGRSDRQINRPLVYLLLLLNGLAMTFACGMIGWFIGSWFDAGKYFLNLASGIASHCPSWIVTTPVKDTGTAWLIMVAIIALTAFIVVALSLIRVTRKMSNSSIWSHPHFSGATLTQFLYVAAQAGIFSYFINYMTSQVPAFPASWNTGWLNHYFEILGPGKDGLIHITDAGASTLASVAFGWFLAGRFSGALLLKRYAPQKMLGLYGLINVLVCLLIFCHLGWLSVLGIFLSYFFMSIMFPTIFALGINGLGVRAKKASGFIVMAIMGGAILPKLMGHVGDNWGKAEGIGMSRAFIVPMACFIFVAAYGFLWPLLSKSESAINGNSGQ